ncbi:unnamed protein product [Macrosiphum euphorbiae]|uniref:Uncharacterized protein n=1 Tax=Macrosiphum euphorbiae TaxID=13131 RepID=A0AAV0XHI9_9HEMI|nr:unnamed protein product [Macrosiphum euphorbiae]
MESDANIGLTESLERVQRKCLPYISYKRQRNTGDLSPSLSIPRNMIQMSIQFQYLDNRRQRNDIYFMTKLANGTISSPELLKLVQFHVPL